MREELPLRHTAITPKYPRHAGEPMPQAVSVVHDSSGSAITVLVVEDEESLRVPVAKILRRRGFVVLETDDGDSAINLFREKVSEIDVVFLDMTLPSKSGAEVCAELQRIQPFAKVILTSAFSEETVMSTLDDQMPWAYIRKPYALAELAGLLQTVRSSGITGAATSR